MLVVICAKDLGVSRFQPYRRTSKDVPGQNNKGSEPHFIPLTGASS